MIKDTLKENEGGVLKETVENHNMELLTENTQSEDMVRFQKQQTVNLQIKEAMARELTEMELPDYMVNEILKIEDEVPF